MHSHGKRSLRFTVIALISVSALTTGLPAGGEEAGSATSAAQLLGRHRQASGADAGLAGIETLSMRGVAEAGTMRFEIHERRKRPGKIRMEFVRWSSSPPMIASRWLLSKSMPSMTGSNPSRSVRVRLGMA